MAFIGISNWALDPAKMNRGVMLTRGEPSSDELTLSARGICSNQDNDRVREKLEGLFVPLSEAYYAICKKQEKDFFGLRDFYRCVVFMCISGKFCMSIFFFALQSDQNAVLDLCKIKCPST